MLIKTIRFTALFVLTHIFVNTFIDFSLYQAHPDVGLNVVRHFFLFFSYSVSFTINKIAAICIEVNATNVIKDKIDASVILL